MKLNLANPVIRHGEEVLVSNPSNNITHIEEKIKDYTNKGYKSIAIICKEEKDVNKYYEHFKNKMNVSKLDEFSLSYDGGVCILPVALAKGLEFDSVIVYSDEYSKYLKNERNLLYVACTRCQHELYIYN